MREKKPALPPQSLAAQNEVGYNRLPTDSDFEIERWHLAQIEAGLADADAGRVISHEDVKALAKTWRKRQ